MISTLLQILVSAVLNRKHSDITLQPNITLANGIEEQMLALKILLINPWFTQFVPKEIVVFLHLERLKRWLHPQFNYLSPSYSKMNKSYHSIPNPEIWLPLKLYKMLVIMTHNTSNFWILSLLDSQTNEMTLPQSSKNTGKYVTDCQILMV